MAPSSGFHKLVTRNYRLLKVAWKKATTAVQERIPASLRPADLVPARVGARQQPLHPVAYLKQLRSRSFSTQTLGGARQFSTNAPRGLKFDRSAFPTSRTASAVQKLPGRTPFASTLRPNLTGGTLGRTAGGYCLGSGRVGGARYFSHGPAAPAQVIQNVSQAVRAFCISGQKAQYGGVHPRTGEKQYRAVSSLQDETSRKMAMLPIATPGSYVDFTVNPTITALTPLSSVAGYTTASSPACSATATLEQHINTDGLLDVLSADFSRALKDLAAVLSDLKKLSSLGDLPITYRTSGSCAVLRVHFPGCDAGSVDALCLELGVTRGVTTQDKDFDAYAGTEIALLFPFAPSEADEEDLAHSQALFTPANPPKKQPREHIVWQDMLSTESEEEKYSTRSEQSGLDDYEDEEGYASLSPPHSSQRTKTQSYSADSSSRPLPLEYHDDFEGLYRFIELCDSSRR